MADKHQRITAYQSRYLDDYDFEKVMVWARQKYITSLVDKIKPEVVVEIGCGFDQLYGKVKSVSEIKRWIIVEPAHAFCEEANKLASLHPNVDVIQQFFEDAVQSNMIPASDLCICSGLLQEIEFPGVIIDASKHILREGGILHVNVANAYSFHRELAQCMDILSDVHDFSERNKSLMQYHVFDMNSIRSLIEKSGLTVEEEGGYFMKPFTHAQMEKIVEVVGDEMIEGLWKMGKNHPGLASEIYINARKTTT